ncbi:MAG: putative porin [Flavisolibacter sp.]
MTKILKHTILLILVSIGSVCAFAQKPGNILRGIGNKIPAGGGFGSTGSGGSDSIKARNKYEDSVTVNIYYLDSAGAHKEDSSINDFTNRFPIPATHIYLGNTGTATRSILFAPLLKEGWDPGFHALDVYKWKLENVRFYNVTRPYTELGYMLYSRGGQIIEVVHTQNIKPSWNFSFNYRLISGTGSFRNQKVNHNNYLLTSWYQSPNRRYSNYFVLLGNQLQEGENGGLKRVTDLDSIDFAKDRFLIPTQIGGDPTYSTDFFSTTLYTGNRYRDFSGVLRQQYDFGKKDSIVTDSTVIPLFFPRVRFEHTFRFTKYSYAFKDAVVSLNEQVNAPDSTWYADHYHVKIPTGGSLLFQDKWHEFNNDFSIYSFPDIYNLHQFVKAGVEWQILNGDFFRDSAKLDPARLANIRLHGEYRNLTKNKKWNITAFGNIYLGGYNSGDYHGYISLQRQLNPRFGSLQVGFENINRSPSFIYDQRSGFYLDQPKNFNKENTTHLFGSILLQKLRVLLSGDFYLITNYLYLNNFYSLQQENTVFNVLRINALKTFRLGKHWNLRTELYLQQKAGAADVNFPLLFTRNRLMYEGTLGFRNLNIAMGTEIKYHTPYHADNYSPLLGQFFFQDSTTISNLPDIDAFVHFRIRSFTAYVRAENLNTLRNFGGLHFNNNNLAAPNYPTPGLVIRFGIIWSFVN